MSIFALTLASILSFMDLLNVKFYFIMHPAKYPIMCYHITSEMGLHECYQVMP